MSDPWKRPGTAGSLLDRMTGPPRADDVSGPPEKRGRADEAPGAPDWRPLDERRPHDEQRPGDAKRWRPDDRRQRFAERAATQERRQDGEESWNASFYGGTGGTGGTQPGNGPSSHGPPTHGPSTNGHSNAWHQGHANRPRRGWSGRGRDSRGHGGRWQNPRTPRKGDTPSDVPSDSPSFVGSSSRRDFPARSPMHRRKDAGLDPKREPKRRETRMQRWAEMREKEKAELSAKQLQEQQEEERRAAEEERAMQRPLQWSSEAREARRSARLSHRMHGCSLIGSYTLQDKLGEGTFGVVFHGYRKHTQEAGRTNADAITRMVTAQQQLEKRKVMLARARAMCASADERHKLEGEARALEEYLESARRVQEGDEVALKSLIFHSSRDGMPITSLREIRILKMLRHPCIVPLLDMAVEESMDAHGVMKIDKTYMVFPYMDHDLAGLLGNPKVVLQAPHIKQYAQQMFEGIAYMHRNHIMHRDLKVANLLINNQGRLVIADFGLARSCDAGDSCGADAPAERHHTDKEYTGGVVTRWYRAPELLLGAKKYTCAVDLWSAGCILAEMFVKTPIFPGTSNMDQLDCIFRLCGTPSLSNPLPELASLPGVDLNSGETAPGHTPPVQKITRWKEPHRRTVMDEFIKYGALAADLIDRLLVLDPDARITADQVLDHTWFWTNPMPTHPQRMPVFESSHEMDSRQNKVLEIQQKQKAKLREQQQQRQRGAAAAVAASSGNPAAAAQRDRPAHSGPPRRPPPPFANMAMPGEPSFVHNPPATYASAAAYRPAYAHPPPPSYAEYGARPFHPYARPPPGAGRPSAPDERPRPNGRLNLGAMLSRSQRK